LSSLLRQCGCQCQPSDPTGACCIGESCSIKTEDACLASFGVYLGDDVPCTPSLCDAPDVCPPTCFDDCSPTQVYALKLSDFIFRSILIPTAERRQLQPVTILLNQWFLPGVCRVGPTDFVGTEHLWGIYDAGELVTVLNASLSFPTTYGCGFDIPTGDPIWSAVANFVMGTGPTIIDAAGRIGFVGAEVCPPTIGSASDIGTGSTDYTYIAGKIQLI